MSVSSAATKLPATPPVTKPATGITAPVTPPLSGDATVIPMPLPGQTGALVAPTVMPFAAAMVAPIGGVSPNQPMPTAPTVPVVPTVATAAVELHVRQVYALLRMAMTKNSPTGLSFDPKTVGPILKQALDELRASIPAESDLDAVVQDPVSQVLIHAEYARLVDLLQAATDNIPEIETGMFNGKPGSPEVALRVLAYRMNGALSKVLPELANTIKMETGTLPQGPPNVASFLSLTDQVSATVNDPAFKTAFDAYISADALTAWNRLQLHVQQAYNYLGAVMMTLNKDYNGDTSGITLESKMAAPLLQLVLA